MGWCWSEGSIWSFKSCSCRITRSQHRKQSTVGAVGMVGVGSGLKFRSSSWVPATLTGRTLIPVPSLSTQDLAAFLQTAPTVSGRRQRRVSLWSHHSPRGIRHTLPHQLRLPLCPCQLFLKLLGQASLFAVTIPFLLEMKDTIRDKRFVGSCSCGSKDITRTPWVSIPTASLALDKIPWTPSRMIMSECLEVAPPNSALYQAPLEILGHTEVWEALP